MRFLWKLTDQCCMNCKNFRWKKRCLCASFMKLCPSMVSLNRLKTTPMHPMIMLELNRLIIKSIQIWFDTYHLQVTTVYKEKRSRWVSFFIDLVYDKSVSYAL